MENLENLSREQQASTLVTLVSVACIIDIAQTTISNMSGRGVEVITPEGESMEPEQLNDLISRIVYRGISDKLPSVLDQEEAANV